MGQIYDKFGYTFRDFATVGVPSSGPHDPEKVDIRALALPIEAGIAAAALSGTDLDAAMLLVQPLLQSAQAAQSAAEKTISEVASSVAAGLDEAVDRATRDAERFSISADESADRAEIASQSSQASSNYYPTRAAGEAATATGGAFSTDDGAGNLITYRKTSGGSVEIARALTPAALATPDNLPIVGKNISGGSIYPDRVRRNGFYNFRSDSFPRWSAALAKHRAGAGRANIACIGNSITRGVGSNPADAKADLIRRSWPSGLASTLNQMPNTKAVSSSLWGDGYFDLVGPNRLSVADPRVTYEAGWQRHATLFATGGKAFQYPDSASGSGRFNFDVSATYPDTDTVDVYYVTSPGFSDMLVTTNDATTFVTSTPTTGPNGVAKITGTRADFKSTAWTIQRAAGMTTNLIFFGIEAYKAADKPIGVWNMGASGSRARDWVSDNQPYSFVNVLPFLAPDLTIISLVVNDYALEAGGTDPVIYKAQMRLIIQAALVSGDVLLIVDPPSNTGAATAELQKAFGGYIRDLSDEFDLPVLDFQERWISQAFLPQRGLYYDGLHPSNVGAMDEGSTIASVVGNPGYFFG